MTSNQLPKTKVRKTVLVETEVQERKYLVTGSFLLRMKTKERGGKVLTLMIQNERCI